MQGLNNKVKAIHGYIFIISCGVIFGALIETLYQERAVFASSIIMGIFFGITHRVNCALHDEPIYTKALISTFLITGIELIIGFIANRIFSLHLWDFSDSMIHLFGQICPREMLIRFIFAYPIIYLSKFADRLSVGITGEADG